MKNDFEIAAAAVVASLRINGFDQEAVEVSRLAAAARSPETSESALSELATMCHFNRLGNVNVNADGWSKMLSTLRSAASEEFIDVVSSDTARMTNWHANFFSFVVHRVIALGLIAVGGSLAIMNFLFITPGGTIVFNCPPDDGLVVRLAGAMIPSLVAVLGVVLHNMRPANLLSSWDASTFR